MGRREGSRQKHVLNFEWSKSSVKLLLSLENPKVKVPCIYVIDSSLDWMNITCDFCQEMMVWPAWVCHSFSIFFKRAYHIACQIPCLFHMLLEIWGRNVEAILAACGELVSPSNLGRDSPIKRLHKAQI